MKKRICSILLALCMVCTVIPFPDKVLNVDAAESDMSDGIFEDDFEDGFANWQTLTIANPPVSAELDASTVQPTTMSTVRSAVLKEVYGDEFALSEDNKAVYPSGVFMNILTPDGEHSIPGRVKKISFDAYIPTTTTEYIFNFIPYYDSSDSAYVKMDGGAINDSDRAEGYARFRFWPEGSNISVSGGTWNNRMTSLDSKMGEWMHIELAYDYTDYVSYEDHASNQLKITISITTVNTESEVVTNSQTMTIKAASSGTVTDDFVFGFYESNNRSYYDNFKIEYDEFAVEANNFRSTYKTWFAEDAAITQDNLDAYNACVAAYEELSDTAKNYLTEEKTQLDQLAATYYESAVASFKEEYAVVLGYELSDITFDMYDAISEAYTSAKADYDAADLTLQAALAEDFTKITDNYDYAKQLHTLYTENYFYDDFEDGFANWQTLTMATSPVSTELDASTDKLKTLSTENSAVLKKIYGEDLELSADNKVVYTQSSVTNGQILTPDKEHSIPGRVEKISFDAYIPTTTSETVFMFIPYYNPSSGAYIKMGGGNFDGVASNGDARFRIFPENSISVTGDVNWQYRATALDCKMAEWMHMELDYDYSNYVSYGDSTSNKLIITITVTTLDSEGEVVTKTATVTIQETSGSTINDFIFGFRNNSDQSYYDNFKIEYDEYAVEADGFRSIYEFWFTEGAAITEDTVTDYSACVADYELLSDTAKIYLTEEKAQLEQLAADYCATDIEAFTTTYALLLVDDLSYVKADNYETIEKVYTDATAEYNSANAILKDALTEYYTKITENYNYATPFYEFVKTYEDLFTATTSDITDDTVTLEKLTAFVNDFSALDEALQAKVKEECKYENVVSLRIFALNVETLVNEDFEDDVTGATSAVKYVEGYNGEKAAYFKNDWGEGAEAYIDFGEVKLGIDSFAISYWYKAGENGGASDWAKSSKRISDDVDFSSITDSEQQLGGTVFANKDFSTYTNTGIAVANGQSWLDMSVNAVIGDNDAVKLRGIQTAVDTRWHSVIISVNRDGKLTVYVDGELSCIVTKTTETSTIFHESDISEFTGTLDGAIGRFVLGADANYNYGLRDATVDSFKIYSDYITEEEAATMYACEKLDAKINEVENRIANYTAGTRFSNEDIATVKQALSAAKAVQVAADCSNYEEVASAYDTLRNAFEEFLLGNPDEDALKVVQIASDTHIYMNGDFIYTGSDETEEKRLETLLTEATKLGFNVDTYLNAGDISETSGTNAQKNAFGFYDTYLDLENTLVVQAMGNHDEGYGNGGDTSGTYNKEGFIDRLQEYGLVDAALEYNKDLFDEEGNLTTAYYYATDGAIHYVVLATSLGVMGADEFAWLQGVMEEISKDGKPIFIVDHYTPSYHDYNDYATRTKEVVETIDYSQVYYFCGHAHNGLGYATATTYSKYAENMLVFNLPSSGKSDSAVAHANSAYYYLFYYEDCMVLRARDSVTYEWLTEYDIELPIQMEGPSIVGVGVYKDTENQSVGFKCNLGTLRDREGVTVTEYGMIATIYSSIKSGDVSYEDMTYDAESGDKSDLINVGTSTQNPTVQSNMEFTAHVGKIAPEDYGARYVVRVYVKYSDGVVVYSNNTTEGGSIENATGAVDGYACNSVINVAKWIITNVYDKDATLDMSEIVSNVDGTTITWATGATENYGTKILQWIADNSDKINEILDGNE